MKIALLNSKGGCGKTTSAMFLAQVAANRGHVAEVWDSDPQASATRWAEAADLPFDVVPANIATMRRPVSDKYVFIDTPPGNPQILTAAAEAADLVIIPTMASMSDMDRTWATIDALTGVAPVAVLVTSAETSTRAYRGLVETLEAAEIPVLPPIRKRSTFREAWGQIPSHLWGYTAVLTTIEEALTA
ncbi:ParA family protein [Kocuria marina]|uniref:ParA family protein n=1 Tax=Kocuria TaxID=57493 RepID=UPI00187342A5|nr:cobyrinic acid a,c-diamide synthase [Kocuria marina]